MCKCSIIRQVIDVNKLNFWIVQPARSTAADLTKLLIATRIVMISPVNRVGYVWVQTFPV